jgi:hypothetical protein
LFKTFSIARSESREGQDGLGKKERTEEKKIMAKKLPSQIQ